MTLEEFAARLRQQGQAWGLKNARDEWATHEDPEEETESMPVWLDADAAARCAVDEWAGFAPAPISLQELLDDWLPALDEEAAWLGINFNPEAQGDLVDPVELLDLLQAAP